MQTNTKRLCLLPLLLCLLGLGREAGAQNSGTLINSPSFVTDAGFGQAVSFNGTNQGISLPDPSALDIATASNYTIEARINTTDSTGTKIFLGQITNGGSYGWYFGLANGIPQFGPSGSGYARLLSGAGSIANGAWHMVAVTIAATGQITLYVDGVQTDQEGGTWGTSPGGTSTTIGEFGSVGAGFNFNGLVDEVAFSGVVQYSGNYTPASAPFASSRAGQIALYHLDGSAADTAGTSIPVTNSALYFSPDNSYSDGAGAMQSNNVLPGSTFVTWNTPGAYLKTNFTGTSCAVTLSLSALTAASTPANYYPTCRWSVDNGPFSPVHTLLSTDTALTVASGLSAGTHSLYFQYVGGAGGTVSTPDRWTTPVQAITVTGLALDGSASVTPYTPLAQTILTTADSLGEGVRVNGSTGLPTDQDAFAAAGYSLANALGAEWSNRSLGGGGWTRTGSGGVPPYFTPGNDAAGWWNKYSAGRPLLVAGHLPVIPYIWFNFYGTNDGLQNAADADVTASVSGWLAAARPAAPSSYIIVGIPPGQYKRSAMLAGFTAYQGGNVTSFAAGTATIYKGSVDTKAFLVDLGIGFSTGLTQYPAPSSQASDGLHPLVATDALLGAAYTQAIRAAITPSLTILAITITHNSSSQPVLTWVADPLATSYKIMRSTDGMTYTQIATTAAGTLTYTDTTRPVGGTVYYHVASTH